MKQFITVILLVSAILFCAIPPSHTAPTERMAKVSQSNGYFIFYKCTPADDYTQLAGMDITAAWAGTPEDLIKQIQIKARKKFPLSDGIIIRDESLSSFDVIQFK